MPKSSRSEVVDVLGDGIWRVKLAAVPEKGKANEELRNLFAEFLSVRKNQIELVSGGTSSHKRLRISP